MSSVNNNVANILHTRFGKLIQKAIEDAVGELTWAKLIPYDSSKQVGDSYTEAIVLGNEVGYSIIGNTTEVTNISPAAAAAVKQAVASPCITVLRSVIPWAMITRSEHSEGAFISVMKYIVKNHILSHKKFVDILKYTGRDTTKLLGRVAYFTATYRGVSFTNGTGTLPSTAFGSIAFTNGVNTAGKYVLLQPGDNASGFWVGMQGVKLLELTAALGVAATSKVVSYDSKNGVLQLDTTPVPATATGSHLLAYEGMELGLEMIGIRKILTNTGTLFGISATQYPLWRANQKDLAGTRLTLDKLTDIVADTANASGLYGAIDVIVNNRTLATLITDENALRKYDASYSAEKYQRGARSLEFLFGDITLKIQTSRYIFEGDAVLLNNVADAWTCSGSSDITMELPGVPTGKLMNNLESQTGFAFHTFADTYIMCREPAKQTIIYGINDESAT